MVEINYLAEPTLSLFHADRSFYRVVRGPVRSGKSTGMSIEGMAIANRQVPHPNSGLRRTRGAIIRNTYRELEDTTIKTWLMWFPEKIFGRINRQNMSQMIRVNDLEMEILFRALDRPDDVAKLLSLELTWAWVNEAREVPRAIIDVLGDRVEQYPPASEEGCTWGGVFLDTNPPDEDHWLAEMEANPPDGWRFFVQPGALLEREGVFYPNPAAENIRNLNGGMGYYLKRLPGKKNGYVRVYYCNQHGYIEEGKRVHPEYSDAIHSSKEPLVPTPGLPLHIGIDFGLTPAAAICQKQIDGQWLVLKELVTERLGVSNFVELVLLPEIVANYLSYDYQIWGDPAGNQESQNNETSIFDLFRNQGLEPEPAPSQNPTIRREALSAPLSRMIDGKPGMLIDPSCRTIRKGLSSKFIYKRLRVVGDEKYHEVPDKNFWSHVCEGLEYAMVGAGEGKLELAPPPPPTPPRFLSQGSWMGA